MKHKKILVASLIAGLILGGAGLTTGLVLNQPGTEEATGGVIGNTSNIKMQKLTDTSYKLIATITPSDATYTNLDWTIAFKNASSEWATGKTLSEYVTMEVDSTTLNSTITFVKAFGEQIIVSAKSLQNESATASCTVDYKKRVTSIVAKLNGKSELQTINSATAFTFTSEMTYSDFTIDQSFSPVCEFLSNNPVFVGQSKYNIDLIDDYLDTLLDGTTKYTLDSLKTYLTGKDLGSIKPSKPGLPSYAAGIPEFLNVLKNVELKARTYVPSKTSNEISFKLNCSTDVSGVALDETEIIF